MERQAALATLTRAASQREGHAALSHSASSSTSTMDRDRPGLERKASDRQRDMALARLMGAGPAEPSNDPLTPSFRAPGPPPTLEELQKRHAESRPTTPGTPISPSTPSQQRQEARTNLIRKLSRGREQGGVRGQGARKEAEPRAETPTSARDPPLPIPLQPFESDVWAPALDRSDSSASTSSRPGPASTAPTSVASLESSPSYKREQAARRAPPASLPVADMSQPSAGLSAYTPNTPYYSSEDSPTDLLAARASTAPSIYRPYRHTMERDRDSAFARLTAEDVWEFDNSSGQDSESPRFPISPHSPPVPALPSPNVALLAAIELDRERQASASSAGTINGGGRIGLGLEASQESVAERGPLESGYRFPGSTPSHSVEHAALRAQSRTESPASTGSYRSAASRPQTGPSIKGSSRAESPVEHHTPPQAVRRPRSSSLSQRSGRRPSDTTEVLASLPRRRDSKPQLPARDNSLRSSHGHESSGSDEWEEAARRRNEARKVSQASSKDRILSKLGSILQAAEDRGAAGNSLDDPPRQLLLHAPVLQVVNANTVKDRYLFLFSDILLIAKPIVEEDAETGEIIPPSLDARFVVKSIVEIGQLKLTAQRDDEEEGDPAQKRKHPQLLALVDRFATDPHRAIQTLVTRGGIPNDPHVIANLLFRTPELNRAQLGAFLSAKEARPVLKAYVERFKLGGMRIEDALRSFLASLRLPQDVAAAEYLLTVFAQAWLASNPSPITSDASFVRKLVVAILELNDFLNSGSNDGAAGALDNLFGFANPAVSVDDFIAAFRVKDPSQQCSDEMLTRIYTSIKRERLQQAADNSQALPDLPVTFAPHRLPQRLTYRVPSQLIAVTIPQPDPDFSLRLVGHDLRAEPSTLSFSHSRTQTFRLTGLTLGLKTLHFIKMGANAMLYSGIPVNRSISIERAFMRHTFQLAFVNHLNVKRKYMFSMSEGELRSEWVSRLHESIDSERMPVGNRAAQASRLVALQVLRDSILAPDESQQLRNGKTSSRPGSAGRSGHVRSNSVSKTYAPEHEADLPGSLDSPAASRLGKPRGTVMARRESRDEAAANEAANKASRIGHELALVVRQNSLLPSVLGLMHSLQDPRPFT